MNPHELDQISNDGIKAMHNGNLETACRLFEQAFQKSASDPFCAVGTAYALATFHWGEYGNGVEAKSKYEFVMETGKSALSMCQLSQQLGTANGLPINIEYAQKSITTQMGNAAENLMLLSMSYAEFVKWANELRHFAPDEPILKQLVPSVNAARERGTLWAEEMFNRASTYINIGHFGSSIHPASGACILHLMLSNRKQLRMRQDVWQRTVMAYHATIYEIGYKAEKIIRACKGNERQELSGVHQFMVPLTKGYCDTYPNDEQIAKLLSNATQIADQYRTVASLTTHGKTKSTVAEELATSANTSKPSLFALLVPFWASNLMILTGIVYAVRNLFFSAHHSWWIITALFLVSWIVLVLHKRWLGNQEERPKTDCLRLDNQGLRELPAEVSQITHLRELHLRNNALQALPEAIGNLASLEVLMVSGNALTSLPQSIVKLKKLRVLGLSTNTLEQLPQDIGEISSLVEIYAGGNCLSDLPRSLGKLQHLVKLNVSNNRLATLPAELVNCPQLKYLYLHDNPKLRLSDDELGPPWNLVMSGAAPRSPREILACWMKREG